MFEVDAGTGIPPAGITYYFASKKLLVFSFFFLFFSFQPSSQSIDRMRAVKLFVSSSRPCHPLFIANVIFILMIYQFVS